MHNIRLNKITRFGLTINGCDIYFPTKELCIKIGMNSLKIDSTTKMFEEYRLWNITCHPWTLIDEKKFDRTILITDSISNFIKQEKK
jgi:hypothetical protein